MKNCGTCIALVVSLLSLIAGTQAWGLTVALFPIDDLSSANTSINQEMTDVLRRELTQLGLTVVEREAVEGFMSTRRIRQLGMLQTQEILAARSELGADLVLLGSLCQQSETAAALGMSVSLIRSRDGKTLWTSNKGVSLLNEQRLLGINSPTSLAELIPILAQEIFAGWPQDLEATAGLVGVELREEGSIEVDSVLFSPKYVRPGDEVSCTIRFSVKREEAVAKVFIRVGNRIHMATSEDGLYYRVSWVGSDDPRRGEPIQVAMNSTDPRIIKGLWSGGHQDADYPVSLVLEWPSGKRQETYLGSYVVDSLAPEPCFKLEGKKIDDLITFRNELPVSVLFKRSEPLTQWEFSITSPKGELLLQERGREHPPSQFVWRGQNSKNLRVDSGVYALRLRVWDRAQNEGVVTEKVKLLAPVPGLNLALDTHREGIRAKLSSLDGVGVTYWRMELWSPDNTMVGNFAGETLPAQVDLPEFSKVAGQGKIACVLTVRDLLGLKATKRIPDLLAQAPLVKGSGPGVSPGRQSMDADPWQVDF